MKKKIISLLLAICMVVPMSFSLVACGDDETPGDEATQQSSSTTSGKENFIGSDNITLSYTSTVYDGTEKEPAVVLKYDDKVISSDNYSVAYSNNVDAGTATVVVTSNEDSEVLEAGLLFTTTFKIERHPILVETTNQLNAAIQVSDKNHVVRLAKNINDRKADGKVNPIVIYPAEKNYDLYIDLAGYDLNSYFNIVSKYNNIETENTANVTIYNSSIQESVVGAIGDEVNFALQIMSNNKFIVNLENVKFQGYWAGIATSGNNMSETVVNARYCEFVGTKTSASDITDTSVGAYLPAAKYLYNFTDCEFTGFTGYYAKAGHHNLVGCEVNAVGEFAFKTPVFNGSGANATGSAIIVDSCEDYDDGILAGYSSALTVNINGGRYVSRANYALEEYCTYNTVRKCYAQIYVTNNPIFNGFNSETESYSFEDERCVYGLTVAHKHTYQNELDETCDVCFTKRETANYNIWSGYSENLPVAEQNVIVITTAEELAGLAKAVNLGTTFNGITIKLAANIDLANFAWVPIGYGTGSDSNYFDGTFDGQDYTIYNLRITTFVGGSDYAGASAGVGLFGNTYKNAVIKNVKIDGARVDGNHYVGSLVGYALGTAFENCSVANATVNCVSFNEDENGDKAAALIGHVSSTIADNLSATDSVVNAGRDAGQVVGCITNKTLLTNLSATNVVVSANGTSTGENVKNEVIGRDSATVNYWDGTIGTLPVAVENVISIRYASEFAAFAKAVNEGNDFEGYTIKLDRNLDLMNIEWTPIGYGSYNNNTNTIKNGGKVFKGTFDGANKTIYNLKITEFVGGGTVAGTSAGVGLFGNNLGTIKNLTVDGAIVSGNYATAVIAGFNCGAIIDKCTVKNATVSCIYANDEESGDKAGLIVGYVSSGSTQSQITNCVGKNSTINANRDAGKLIGGMAAATTQTGNTATNVKVSCNYSGEQFTSKTNTNINNEIVGRVG